MIECLFVGYLYELVRPPDGHGPLSAIILSLIIRHRRYRMPSSSANWQNNTWKLVPVFIGSHDKERPAIFSVKLSLDLSHNCCTIASSSSIRWLCTLNLFQLHVFDFGIVGLNSPSMLLWQLVVDWSSHGKCNRQSRPCSKWPGQSSCHQSTSLTT